MTIADFHFQPGDDHRPRRRHDHLDTDDGPNSHTATANGGAFNTGILKQGQSATHTFTQPGTYTYFCQIHPFMHGTIVVLASTTTTTTPWAVTHTTPTTPTTSTATTPTTAATSTSATTATSSTAAAAQPTLPLTGLNVLAGLAAVLLLLGAGAALRRLLAAR